MPPPQTSPPTPAPIGGNTTPLPPPTNLDPSVVTVMRAIANVESKGDYTAIGDKGDSMGAFQWNNGNTPIPAGGTPKNWQAAAQQYLGDANAPMTPENQNYVAYHQIAAYKAQGLTPISIDALWNGASPDPANQGQYVHNNPQRLADFQTALQGEISGTTAPAPSNVPPTYGATFPASANDTPLVAGFKALGNIPSSFYGAGASLVGAVSHPIQTLETLGQGALGGLENLTGQNKGGTPDSNQQVANQIGQALVQRYGSLDALQNTATNDPIGFGADVASILGGGAGLADRAARAANLGELGATDALGAATERVGGAVTGTVGSGAKSVLSPFGALAGGANPDVVSAAARVGTDLPVSAITSNPIIRTAEAFANTGLGNEAAATRVTAAVDQMESFANDLIAKTGGETDLSVQGENIAKGLSKFEDVYHGAMDKIFSAVASKVGDVAAQTGNAVDTIQRILEEKGAIGETADSGWFKDKLAVLTGAKAPKGELDFTALGEDGKPIPIKDGQYAPPTFETLKKLRTALGQKIDKGFDDPFVKTNTAQLKQLYGALSRDIRATIKSTGQRGLLALYDKGNQAYIDGRNLISSSFGKNIQRLAKAGQESRIVDAIIKPSMAIEDVPRIFQVVGEQGTKDIRAAFLQKIFEGARNGEGDFTPTGILRQIKKYGEDKVGAILAPEQLQGVKDLGTVSKALGDSLATQKGSQTAFLLRTYGELGAVGFGAVDLMTGNLIGAATKIGAVLGAEGASYFITSPTGQKLIKWGLTRAAETKQLAQANGLLNEQNGTADADTVPNIPQKAADLTKANGGVTISLKGDVPTSGYAFAPSKETERVVSMDDYTKDPMSHVNNFLADNSEELSKQGNHLGMWENDGKMYFDVSKVGNDLPTAIQEAKSSDQLAVFDLSNFKEYNVADYEKAHPNDTNGGEIAGANLGGGGKNPDGEGIQSTIAGKITETKGKYDASPKAGGTVPDTGKIAITKSPTNDNVQAQLETANSLSKKQVADYITHKKATADVFGEFKNTYDKVAKEAGLGKQEFPANRKYDARAIEKGVNEYGGDFSRVTDMNRGAYVDGNISKIKKLVESVKQNFKVVSVKNRLAKPTAEGYRDIMLKVEMSNGTQSEIQILFPQIEKAKATLHAEYEKSRVLEKMATRTPAQDKALAESIDKQKVGYAKAWKEVLAKNKDVPALVKSIAGTLKTGR